jgi:hypothetical protein
LEMACDTITDPWTGHVLLIDGPERSPVDVRYHHEIKLHGHSTLLSMQTELAVDLDLPSSASQPAATSFECMFEGVAVGGRNSSPPLAVQQQPVEYLRNVDTALDSAVDLGSSSTFDHLLDCNLSVLEDWYPTTTDSQWPSLSAPCRWSQSHGASHRSLTQVILFS